MNNYFKQATKAINNMALRPNVLYIKNKIIKIAILLVIAIVCQASSKI